jgi:hypothetical protein
MDLNTGLVSVHEPDGNVRSGELPHIRDAMRESNIRQFRLDFAAHRLSLVLPNGNEAIAELPWPGQTDTEALGARRVVHLDQRDWSKLAAARHGGRPIGRREANAAEELFELVDAGKIILPISAAHFVESDRLVGPNRVSLASTLLELSRGWQMRHPVNIGRDELAAALGLGQDVQTGGVYTLAPNAAFVRFPAPNADYPEPLRSVMPAVIAVSGTYDAVIDASPAKDEGAEDAQAAWVEDHEELVALFEADGASRNEIRRAAIGRQLVAAAEHLMRESNLDPRNVGAWLPATWLANVERHFATMPYLSRVSQVHFARLRNRSAWHPNDLLDIHNLSAAAGYAHIVVGEKRTIGDLRTVKNVPPGAELVTSLAEAATVLKS